MSLPHHKMISASKSILAHASVRRDTQRSEQHQKQVVNVNIQAPKQVQYPPVQPYEIDENIVVVPANATEIKPQPQPEIKPEPQIQPQPKIETRDLNETNLYIHELQNIVNSNDSALRALVMIIDIMMNNPLIVNKLIVAQIDTFKELVKTLTSANDVDIQFLDEVGCFTSSKYRLIDDIYIVSSDGSAISLKYGFPHVMCLFDRF